MRTRLVVRSVQSQSCADSGATSKKFPARFTLRLNGAAEDGQLVPEEFSGYKVLRRIKELNRGNQVIMLTASNKAWNLKALRRRT